MANNYRDGASIKIVSFDAQEPTGSQNELHVPFVKPSFTNTIFADSTANLEAAAVFTGTARDLSPVGAFVAAANITGPATGAVFTDAKEFAAFSYSSHAGTLAIELSNNNSTWYLAATATTTAGAPGTVTAPALMRYARVKFTNTDAETTTTLVVTSGMRRA